MNIEEWSIEKAMPRQYLATPQGVSVIPDIPNWAWHEYGMRIGFWRLLEALRKRKIPVTTSINAHVCQSYPPVAQAMRDAGWEFMGHGVVQGAMHLLPDQRAAIRESIRIIRAFTGKAPKGWLGPGLTETWETLDLLREEGIEYVSDWVNDDQPYTMDTGNPRMVSLPYTVQCNDVPAYFDMKVSVPEFEQMLRRQFDVLYRESEASGRVMVHPFVTGQPHRVVALERALEYICAQPGVWKATGWEIVQHYLQTPFAKAV